ncbi:glycosyltransferase family 4 protein [Hanstruepera ponticola]|uniref:glycosyltransferase family 4 protein n=1 Tax=Hanstruepera ponticola TaxID=2042995 RepID=UPI0017869A35|nr:glycosyltransferase family 4 protein [Hanstruepera ponticola]
MLKPKIIHIVNLQSYGGIQKLTLELTSSLNAMGTVENHILATKTIDLLSESLPQNVNIIKFNNQNPILKFKKVLSLFKDYDIIHFHGPFTFIQLAAMFSNKKIVYTEHGTLQKANIKSNFKHLIQKRIVGKNFLEKFVDKVIFISKWIQKDLDIKNKSQIVIYNGLKYHEPNIIKNEKFILTIAARLIPKKRVHLAIELMHELYKDTSIKLQIIGDGNEMENLKKQAGNLLNKTVFFLGYRKDAYDLIASSDIYLMTTDMEPFGLVVLEAMMSQTLVLSYHDSGGPTEIFENQFSRLLVNNVSEMAEAVLYWKEHPEKKEIIEMELKNLYTQKYTLNHMAENYSKVYFELFEAV